MHTTKYVRLPEKHALEKMAELEKNNAVDESYIKQVREMAAIVHSAGLNIDYFPTNFVVQNGVIFYIDYECNQYMDEWNFENWGIKYWSKTQEFIDYTEKHSFSNSNQLI